MITGSIPIGALCAVAFLLENIQARAMSLEDCARFFSLLGAAIEKRSAKSIRVRLVHPDDCAASVKVKLTPAGKLEVTRRKGDALVFALTEKQLHEFLTSGEAPLWHDNQILAPPLPPPPLEEFQCEHEEMTNSIRRGAVSAKRFREHLLRAPISLFDLLGKQPSLSVCAEIDQKIAEECAVRLCA